MVIADPLRLGGVIYEPFPMWEAFCRVIVLDESRGGRGGQLVLTDEGGKSREFGIERIECTDQGCVIRASDAEERTAVLTVRGEQESAFAELKDEAARWVGPGHGP